MNRFLMLLAVIAIHSASAQSSSSSLTSSVSSSSSSSDVPLCNTEELVEISDEMTTNARKLQCQEILDVKEMVTIDDPLLLCDQPSCVTALQQLYNSLPQCRYKDWAVQENVKMLLLNCGIKPVNTTSSASGSSTDGSVSWTTSSSGSDVTFAPVGTTAAPSTPTPTPASSNGIAITASVVLAAFSYLVVTIAM